MGQYIRYIQTARMPMKWEKNIVQPAEWIWYTYKM